MTPNKEKALRALLTAPTRAQAARDAGISETTMAKYFAEPDFKAAYDAQFRGLMEAATRRAQQCINPALDALRDIVADTEQSPQARISAARSILEYSLKLSERLDISDRLEALEAQIEGVEHEYQN